MSDSWKRAFILPILGTVLLASVFSMISENAFACGESMFRVGNDVHYRAYSAPIPGSVLVYARTDDERAVAERLQQSSRVGAFSATSECPLRESGLSEARNQLFLSCSR